MPAGVSLPQRFDREGTFASTTPARLGFLPGLCCWAFHRQRSKAILPCPEVVVEVSLPRVMFLSLASRAKQVFFGHAMYTPDFRL